MDLILSLSFQTSCSQEEVYNFVLKQTKTILLTGFRENNIVQQHTAVQYCTPQNPFSISLPLI